MTITDHNTVGEIVAQDYRTAAVFQSFDIDFCCKGNHTLREACENKHLDVDVMLADLEHVMHQKDDSTPDFQSWPLDLLADYIEKTHHRYVEKTIPVLKQYLVKVCKVHGKRYPELYEIADQFNAAAAELTSHMKKEELILFPYIRTLVQARFHEQFLQRPPFGTIQHPITMMMQEHDVEGERFRKIAMLSGSYTPPPDACTTFTVTYSTLKQFEGDLHRHIHLENNILFPNAIALEATFA
ncbi:MAG TPA: iron-sulfur cluster repair di-iron protein [Saprospiraceae bacterium]|nr:iron-sulfur cluster repair di-iron protein [Saprospiraceae bacterium]